MGIELQTTSLETIKLSELPEAIALNESDYSLIVQNGTSKKIKGLLLKGNTGDNGKSIEIRKTDTHIQWRQEGGQWINLVALADLKGDKGEQGGGANVDLTDYATKVWVTQQLASYYTKAEIDLALSNKANKSDIPSLNGYATETFVTNKIAEASLSGGEVDLSGYATKDELNAKADATHTHTEYASIEHVHNYNDLTNKPTIPSKTSDLTNDSGFITAIPSEYVTETEVGTAVSSYVTEHKSELKGDQGEKGDTGAKGDKGDTGAKGDKGDKGADGAKGDKGDKGDPFTYSDFTPEQLAALKGAKGDKGDKGDPGAKGEAGTNGKDGLTTAVSVNGNTYTHVNGTVTLPNYPIVPTKISQLTNDSSFATESYVTDKIAEAALSGGEVDLSGYATKTYTDNAISTALDGHTFRFLTQAEYDTLTDEEKNNSTIEYHITDSVAEDLSIYQTIRDDNLNTTNKTIVGAINETFQSVSNGKTLIASAITDKGVTTSNTDTFQTMADNIGLISSSTPSESKDPYREGRVLIWEDDFNGETLDLNSWDYEIEKSRNGEAQVYIAENVSVSNSNLVITAKKESHNGYNWTSGCIHSNNKREFQYGRIEAKIKMPRGVSFFPAFWMLGANFEYDYINHTELGVPWAYCGEIDIMECVTEEDRSNCAMLWNVGSGTLSTGKQYSPTIDPSEYNIYSAEWTEDKIEFYVNDILFYTKDITGIEWNGYNCFRQPHFLLINLAMGGINAPSPDNTTPDGAQMLVDWVRVYSPYKYNFYPTDVALTKTEAQMIVGDELILFANITDGVDKNLVWESSNTECATVNGGKIRAIANGSATITATTRNNLVSSCIVSVSEPIPVNSISLNKESTEIRVGDSETLIVSFTPSNASNKNITWRASNSNATVSNGIVTGVTEGECIITATSEDGGYIATCTVNVVSVSTGLVYSFNNFDVDTCVSEGKIHADNDSSVYLEAKGTLTNSEGKLISNGTLLSSFDCANVLKDKFTFDITLRRVNGAWIGKGLYFNCLSPNSPWEGFNAYCKQGNSLVAEFNVGGTKYTNTDTSVSQTRIINIRVTKNGNTINLYRDGELVHTTSVTASWSASKYLAIGGNSTSTKDMLGEFEFIGLSIYSEVVI